MKLKCLEFHPLTLRAFFVQGSINIDEKGNRGPFQLHFSSKFTNPPTRFDLSMDELDSIVKYERDCQKEINYGYLR